MNTVIMNTTSAPIISMRNLDVKFRQKTKWYLPARTFYALRGVDIDIYEGETLGIIGRNGAGKSTLLKIMAGILRPDNGVIYNRGVSISLLALQAGFDWDLDGHDNAIINGMLLGYSKRDVKALLPKIREFSGLGDFFDQPIRTYSSGMVSRLAFSVAIYMRPDVLLLDEVLSVGDQEFRRKAEAEMMKKIHSQQTVVLVSHSQEQVKRLCDRVIDLETINHRFDN